MNSSGQIIDELLVINCQRGDKKALELLIKRWDNRIVKRVYSTTQDHFASRDIAQDVWITIIRKIKSLKDPKAFEWWSLRIATRKSVDWIRANQLNRRRDETRKMVQKEFETTEVGPSDEILNALREAIASLPMDQQAVIQMFYRENLSVQNIAKILDIPSGTVKSRLFQAREKLKGILKNKIVES